MQSIKSEVIMREANDPDAWICVCGNRPIDDGFFPCDARGNEVEPIAGVWNDLYVCDRCGRIIKQGSLAVVGRRGH